MMIPFHKILIVSASIGEGHQQAAKALAAELRRAEPDVSVQIADFMDGESSYLNALLKEAYLKMIHLSPNIYDLLYRWSQTPSQFPTVQNLLARAMKRSMTRLYLEHRPDLIVFTHPFPCAAAAYLKRRHRIDVPLAAVVTDFSVHPLWAMSEVDMYFVASLQSKQELSNLEIDERRVFPTGIPIQTGFGRMINPSLKESIGLKPDLPTVLVMGGGLGLGPLEEAVRALGEADNPLQLVVISGKNAEFRRLAQQIAKSSRNPIRVLGYTGRVRELMAAADILVTKPGALTLSEALASGLPMVLLDPIAGQEEDNARHLVEQGAAILVNGHAEVGAVVAELLRDTVRHTEMKKKARQMAHPYAASAAARLLLKHGGLAQELAASI